MVDIPSVPSLVVGIDGSQAAVDAAIWAVAEAVGRDIPLRLVYVIDLADSAAGSDHGQFACARAALYDAQRSVEATGEPVKVETEILSGRPLAKLAEASRSAAMVCVGSIGTEHALHGTGSVAAALPGLAQSPVAVIRPAQRHVANARAGTIVVEVEDVVALRYAFDEARLRGAPLRVAASWRAEVPDDIAEGSRLAQAQLDRRLAPWTRLYPDVAVESMVVRGSICGYLSRNAAAVDIFVTSGGACGSGSPDCTECSVLTVRGNYL